MAIAAPEARISPDVSRFIRSPRNLLIDGKWVSAASGKRFPVYNPATGTVMCEVAEADAEDVHRPSRRRDAPSTTGRGVA